jgi:hypothetical protein
VSIQQFDVWNSVWCDICNEDYTNSDERGGFLLQSKAVCPKCQDRVHADVVRYGEEQYIRKWCPPDMSFKEWCLELRSGNNTIKILSDEDVHWPLGENFGKEPWDR